MKLIKQWRFAMKCMKYSNNVKVNMICGGIMVVLGLICQIMDVDNNYGAFLMLMMVSTLVQLLYNISGSQMVQASPYKKALTTSLPSVINLVGNMAIYILVVVIEVVRCSLQPQSTGESVRLLLIFGMMAVIMDIYIGTAYKYYLLSVVLMAAAVLGLYSGFINHAFRGSADMLQSIMPVSLLGAIGISLCMVLLGSLLQYGISLLLYKKPMSRWAVNAMMRQQV